MSRIKLQYTPKEIITDLYTYGLEWMTDRQIEYKGLYHKYTTGEVYTEPVWDANKSIILVPYVNTPFNVRTYKQLKPKIKTKFNSIYPINISIDPTDIKKTFITRYFLQKQTDYSITEINSAQYDDFSSGLIDTNVYKSVTIKWYIAGPLFDEGDGVKVLGVLTKNKMSLNAAEKDIIGIQSKLTNFAEYYTDTDFKVPKDING
jgi:hypothetical protein